MTAKEAAAILFNENPSLLCADRPGVWAASAVCNSINRIVGRTVSNNFVGRVAREYGKLENFQMAKDRIKESR